MAEGLKGLIDFVGYPASRGAAVAPPARPAGFRGLLDFVGYPVARGVGSPFRHGPKVGGIRNAFVSYMMEEARERSVLDGLRRNAQQAAVMRQAARWREYTEYVNAMNRAAAMATILAEV